MLPGVTALATGICEINARLTRLFNNKLPPRSMHFIATGESQHKQVELILSSLTAKWKLHRVKWLVLEMERRLAGKDVDL